MKKALFFTFLILFLFCGCNKEKSKNESKSNGKINEITLIIDEQLWNGEVGDSIRNKFAAPVIGLPQEEPLFTINQYSSKYLQDYLADSRNIIVVKREKNNLFKTIENKFAKPQNIFHISGKTANIILTEIEKNAPQIISKIRDTEIRENQKTIDTALIDAKKIEQKFKIKIHIPKGYNCVFEKKKFVWLKKEITIGSNSLIIYQVPIKNLKKASDLTHKIIKMRDSIGNLYIHGSGSKSRMMTESSYAPYLFNTIIDYHEAYETRGTWQMLNDYMSGPFINYCILDNKNKRVLVLEGFCYAPSKEKRDLMFELEAIIKTVKID